MSCDDYGHEYLRGTQFRPDGADLESGAETSFTEDVPAVLMERKVAKGLEEGREEKIELWMTSIREFIRAIDTQKL